MKYQQLTEGDRYTLAALKRQRLSFTNIAKAMNRDRSTIYRKINRNSCWIIDGSYRPSKAQRRTRARRRRSRRNQHFTDQDYKIVVAHTTLLIHITPGSVEQMKIPMV